MFGKKKSDAKVIGTTAIDGLPVNQGSDLIVKITPDGMSILVASTKQTFEIDNSKIASLNYYNETEMEKVISQSAPGMIIGAAAFGILGAMIGGRVKTKNVATVSHFIVINYESNGKKQIVMQTNDSVGAIQMIDFHKNVNPSAYAPTNIAL